MNLPVCAKLYHPTAIRMSVNAFFVFEKKKPDNIRSRYRQPSSFSTIINRVLLLYGWGFLFEVLVETRGTLGSERLTTFGHRGKTMNGVGGTKSFCAAWFLYRCGYDRATGSVERQSQSKDRICELLPPHVVGTWLPWVLKALLNSFLESKG